MAKTLEQGFEALIGRLAPLSSEHDKASKHKDSVKSCLVNNFECSTFFETGSFGSGTGVRHCSDTDYFAVIPSKNLNQLSSTSLRKVKEALQGTFWQTEGIEVKCPAVAIPFGQYASEFMEVTPCSFEGIIETPIGKHASYDIPDCADGWMRSSPNAHNAYVKKQDERLSGKVKPLIQLVKAWKYYNNVPIRSFYLELRVAKYAETENAIIYDIDLYRIFKWLSEINLARIIDPMGVSGYISPCGTQAKLEDANSKLQTAFGRAEKAYEQRDKDLDKCFYWWNLLFNDLFPSR